MKLTPSITQITGQGYISDEEYNNPKNPDWKYSYLRKLLA
jgi:hypothetical protein